MPPEVTLVLAVWGAVVGTLSLLWNIWTWSRNRPEIVATAELRDLPVGELIFFEVRNRGSRPTTIEEVRLVKYLGGPMGWLGVAEHVEFVSAKHRHTFKLPVVLGPNEMWKADCPARQREHPFEMDKIALVKAGRLFFKIRCAHSDHQITGRVKPEGLHLRD